MTSKGPIDTRVSLLEEQVARLQGRVPTHVTPSQVGRHSDFRIAQVASSGSTIGKSFLCKFVDGTFPDGGGNTEATWRDRQDSAKITVYNLANQAPVPGVRLPVWYFRGRWWTYYQTVTSTPFEKFVAQQGYMFTKSTSSVALSAHTLGTLICNEPDVSNGVLRWLYTWPTTAITYNESQLNLEDRGNVVCSETGMYSIEAYLIADLVKESGGISDPTVDEALLNYYVAIHRIRPNGSHISRSVINGRIDVRDREWELLTGNPPYHRAIDIHGSPIGVYEYASINYPLEAGDEVYFEYRIIGPDGFGTYVAPSGFSIGIFNAYSNLFGFSTHGVT